MIFSVALLHNSFTSRFELGVLRDTIEFHQSKDAEEKDLLRKAMGATERDLQDFINSMDSMGEDIAQVREVKKVEMEENRRDLILRIEGEVKLSP